MKVKLLKKIRKEFTICYSKHPYEKEFKRFSRGYATVNLCYKLVSRHIDDYKYFYTLQDAKDYVLEFVLDKYSKTKIKENKVWYK